MEQVKRRKQSQQAAAADAGMEWLGDFHIVREIGRGGMGIVYEAEQKALGRRVALKVLPQHYLLDAKRLQRFQREAQAAARLHHTNIVPVFGVGECQGLHYYVMQYVDGHGLNQVIEHLAAQRSSLSSDHWRWVARLGVQVADALQYAHEQGVLHRDIKPANVLLDNRGTVWITDFGLAKLSEHTDLTALGDIVGTLHYLAPEALESRADRRSDVYGLGLTLYELLTLQQPFTESNPAKLLRQISERELPRPSGVNPRIPRDLETIVLKASARSPDQRYSSAAELADDLRRFLDDRPIQARQAGAAERLWRCCRRNRAVASLSLAAVVSLLLALVVGWIGYVRTTEALDRESRRRKDADEATRRAEANVAMSLQALEEMFNQIKSTDEALLAVSPPDPGPGRPGLGPPPDNPVSRTDSRENAALLQSILEFYGRFAQANAANSSLQFEAAKAHRRVGDIQQRLGELNKAQQAYERAATIAATLTAAARTAGSAITQYVALSAELEGRLGQLARRQGMLRDAEAHFRKAVEMGLPLVKENPEVSAYRLSLALAQQSLGEFLWRQQHSPEARGLLEQAIANTERCISGEPKPPLRVSLGMQYRCLSDILAAGGERDKAQAARRKAEQLGVGPPPPLPPLPPGAPSPGLGPRPPPGFGPRPPPPGPGMD
ncbi:MAG: serine/threonine-protein kinase [Planctomycetota bacterium]|nr:serine/threonine-protein kinase [Planctomycetota bacterium]